MAKRTFAIVAVFAALLSVTLSVQAEELDYYWVGKAINTSSPNNNYWTNTNWRIGSTTSGVIPAADSMKNTANSITAYILNDSNEIKFDYDRLGDAVVRLNLGQAGNTGSAVLNRSGGQLLIQNDKTLAIGKGGTLTYSPNNATKHNLSIESGGVLSITGGKLDYTTSMSKIDIQSGGTLSISGDGVLSSKANIDNAGAFTQTGGTLSATSTFTMTGGTFTQSAGSFSVANLTLSGGTMSATTIDLNSGSGTFTQSGGTLSSYGSALTITGSYSNTNGTIAYTGKINVTNTVALNYATIDLSTYFTTPGQTITLIQAGNGISNDSSFTINGAGWNTDFNDTRTELTATFSGDDNSYYWEGSANNNSYRNNSNWSSGANIGDYTPDKNYYILSTPENENVNLDYTVNDNTDVIKLGVVSLTVGSGSTTQSATIESDSNKSLDVDTALAINKGGSAIINGALSISETLTVEGGTVTANSTTGVFGALNITNGSFNATGAVTVNDHGSVSITGGELTSSAALSVNNGGGLTVHGGTVNAQNATNVAGTLTITSGRYNATGDTTVNTGGTLTVTSGMYSSTGETTVNAGGTLTVDGGTYDTNKSTVISGATGNLGILNISAGTFYSTNNVTVNNGGSVSVTGGTYTAANTTVNTGGSFSYTSSNDLINTGTFLIDGGTFEFSVSNKQLINKGVITINSGDFKVTSTDSLRIGYGAVGVLNINGGSLTVGSTSTTAPTYIAVNTNGTVNQYDGTATFKDTFALGWGSGNGTYNLYGGTIITEEAAGLWISNNNPNTGSQFNVYGGVANFNKSGGESFTIGLDGSLQKSNIFNLYSGTVNAADTFAVKYGGTLNVAKNGEDGGDGVLNAKGITLSNNGNLNMSSGTINLGSGGITNSGDYNITLSGGTFGTTDGSGDGWSTTLNATIANNTAITFAPGEGKTITWSGNLTNLEGEKGGLIVDGKGTLTLTQQPAYKGKTTVKQGTLNLPAGGTLYNLEGGSLKSNGHTDIAAVLYASDGTTKKDIVLSNSELSKFIGSITAQTITKEGDGTLQIYGEARGAISVDSLVISSGRIDLKGYMTGGITVNGGAFSPGNSVGEATFGGDFIINDNGKLLLEIDGTGADRLNDGGDFTNDGLIEVSWQSGVPLASEYILIDAANLADISDLGTIQPNFAPTMQEWYEKGYIQLLVEDNKLKLTINHNAVPEPSTWALLILGAAGMLYWRKRKNNK